MFVCVCVPESHCKDNTLGKRNVLECPPMSLNVLKCLDKGKIDWKIIVGVVYISYL